MDLSKALKVTGGKPGGHVVINLGTDKPYQQLHVFFDSSAAVDVNWPGAGWVHAWVESLPQGHDCGNGFHYLAVWFPETDTYSTVISSICRLHEDPPPAAAPAAAPGAPGPAGPAAPAGIPMPAGIEPCAAGEFHCYQIGGPNSAWFEVEWLPLEGMWKLVDDDDHTLIGRRAIVVPKSAARIGVGGQ